MASLESGLVTCATAIATTRSRALGESLAALATQIADLRGQIRTISGRLDQSGLSAGVNLAARFEELDQTVTGALEAAAPRGPAAPYWIGLDRDTYATRLADLRQWADTVLRQQYGGYELRDCWPRHIHAVWELSTLAASLRTAAASTCLSSGSQVILPTRFSYPRTSASGKARRIS